CREEVERDAGELFNILIRPVEGFLEPDKPLFVVPDKVLTSLPFGALVAPASGRFLIEDYLLAVSPSSSLLVICSEMAAKKAGPRDERLLCIGNPRFDRTEFPDLPDLPSSLREAEGVASFYNSKCLLTGYRATSRQLRGELPRADVIHLALHFV